MMQRWGTWGLLVGCVLALSMGCDEEREVAEASSGEAPATSGEPAPGDEGPGEAEGAPAPADGPSGTVDGEPFVTRGVLARKLRDPEIEIRLFDRPASCETFDADYELDEDEKVVIIMLEWPKPAGDTVALRAQEVHERLQFCAGRASGRASCEPRAPEQGSLTVVEASEEGGELSFDVASDEGTLSGNLEFTLCPR